MQELNQASVNGGSNYESLQNPLRKKRWSNWQYPQYLNSKFYKTNSFRFHVSILHGSYECLINVRPMRGFKPTGPTQLNNYTSYLLGKGIFFNVLNWWFTVYALNTQLTREEATVGDTANNKSRDTRNVVNTWLLREKKCTTMPPMVSKPPRMLLAVEGKARRLLVAEIRVPASVDHNGHLVFVSMSNSFIRCFHFYALLFVKIFSASEHRFVFILFSNASSPHLFIHDW